MEDIIDCPMGRVFKVLDTMKLDLFVHLFLLIDLNVHVAFIQISKAWKSYFFFFES